VRNSREGKKDNAQEKQLLSRMQRCRDKGIFASPEPIMGGGRPTLTVYVATRSYWEDGCPIEGRAWEEPEDEGEVFDWVEVIE
jgi:hypothetical protein